MMSAFLINVAVVFVLNFWSYKKGWRDRERSMIHNMAANPDVMLEALNKVKELDIAESATEVEVEVNDNCFYIYNKESKLFLGQGPSLDDAMETVCHRFPDQAFWCDDEQIDHKPSA